MWHAHAHAFQPVGGPGWERSGCKRLFPARALGTSSLEGRDFGHSQGQEPDREVCTRGQGCLARSHPGPRRPPGGVRKKTQAVALCVSAQDPGPRTTPGVGGWGGLGVAHPQREPPKSIPSPSPAASGFPICRALAGQRGRGRAQPRRPAPLLTKAAARSARP